VSTLGWMPGAERINGLTRYSPGGEAKVGICSHTAGGYLRTMRNPDFWNDSAQCSVHFAIGRKGEKIQLVNIFDRAWGQGRLTTVTWPPYANMGYRNPNEYLISIEREDVEEIDGRTVYLSDWPEVQYQALLEIHRWCRQEIAAVKGVDVLRFGIDSLAGHHMFDNVNRVNCPGPVWRNEIRQRLFNDLTVEIRQGVNDMRIAVYSGIPYLVTPNGMYWIPEPEIHEDLRRLLYGNAEVALSDRTWFWLNTAPGDKTTGFPNGGAGIFRLS